MNIGIIGLGFMGMTHFEAAKSVKAVKVHAISTRDPKKQKGNWSSIQGNFGPRGSKDVDLSDVKIYSDYQELLKDPEIDLVDICLPIPQHEKVAIEALNAGKHVLVEKPVTVEVAAAQRMIKAAEKAGKHLMVAHVLPFFPEFRFLAECLRQKKYGELQALNIRRIISPPKWLNLPDDLASLGGFGIDLHIHDNHFISATCGMPDKVFSIGKLEAGFVNHTQTNYVYDKGPVITCVSGAIAASGLEFAHGYQAFFDEATIEFDAGTYGKEWVVNRPLTVLTKTGRIQTPTLKGGSEWYSAFAEEMKAAAQALKTGDVSPDLSIVHAVNGLKLCHAEQKSIETGKIVSVK
ncbi:Gfo/Idh/MocA family oxidoreductase [Rubinisphaera sp.]|uniref:Gfo/Idh/MocA family protein n=1 Tax=Rubinisphaera sp. TaxID=2024857 RepID=UPI000C0E3828|nr:Gfo/Idh/MocA family oxidoreductase [Rubinisphaera sp.]MBV08996.1 oxidoreductase [Rubinisphaera sp.]HCS50331.1 oxidoreductase [Planctomycetaceae bacterium]|tara:strand:- start:14923 stop:15969 length:1047 start_codon:yes stop_codon:yes gene_type:complete